MPFRLFEGFRSPQRQQHLYSQGRTRPGSIVSRARPWQSFHQYGVAGDFVLYERGRWSWDTTGERGEWWDRLHVLGREVGLKPLSFEKPHLQIDGLARVRLQAGIYPPAGDDGWAQNLASAIESWTGDPASPPFPQSVQDRPPLDPGANGGAPLAEGDVYQVVARRGLRLRAGPGTEFEVIDVLPYGRTVGHLGESDSWVRVDLEGDGAADGFCHAAYLQGPS